VLPFASLLGETGVCGTERASRIDSKMLLLSKVHVVPTHVLAHFGRSHWCSGAPTPPPSPCQCCGVMLVALRRLSSSRCPRSPLNSQIEINTVTLTMMDARAGLPVPAGQSRPGALSPAPGCSCGVTLRLLAPLQSARRERGPYPVSIQNQAISPTKKETL